MRHRNKKAILNRPADQRKALVRNLVTNLFLNGSIQTTGAKAKALASAAEKLISNAKRKLEKKETMNAIRLFNQVIFSEEASKKALEYAQKTTKTSGFTRNTKIRYRVGDSALIVQIELITD